MYHEHEFKLQLQWWIAPTTWPLSLLYLFDGR